MPPAPCFRHGLPPDLVPLVRAARLHPEDTLARLALADWLEEQGPPVERDRGAFIRLQTEAARLPSDGQEARSLNRQAAELRRRHARAWVGELGRVRGVARYDFVRGFVRLHLTEELAQHGGLSHLAALPTWPWVDGLHAGNWLDDEAVSRQAGSSAWGDVTFVHLPCAGWLPALRQLLSTPHPAAWHTLEITYWRGGPDLAGLLAAAPALHRLRVLNLSSAGITDRGALALATAPSLAGLLVLTLGGNELTDRGAVALIDSPYLTGLRRLDLGWGNLVSPSVLERLRARTAGGP